ncbi:ABC transporter permease [Diaminobutyricimonas sp. LJ205]|uniref:ABC transporter permease n=1 Tax=Diaminobutyricimonas sp. LJ205 TaxID=2683590 RepID=UPI0012F4C12F|nr:ABC transporter permease [Diaminobutyricimonas sp. LJ205]
MSIAGLAVDSGTMITRSVRHTLRNLDALLISVILPIMLLLIFTFVFGGAISPDGEYLNYVVPGIILICSGYGASMTAISVTKDMTEGIVDRFRTMSMAASAVLTGHVTASVLRNFVSTGLVIGLAVVLGFRPTGGLLEWLGALGVLTLFILAMSWLAAVFGLLAKSVEAASGFSFAILFLPYVSSAFVPVATLPEWLQPIAEHQPITLINESVRGLLFDLPVGDDLLPAVLWCLGVLLVAITASVLLWRRSARR